MTTLSSKLMLCVALTTIPNAHAAGGALIAGSKAAISYLYQGLIVTPVYSVYQGTKNELVLFCRIAANILDGNKSDGNKSEEPLALEPVNKKEEPILSPFNAENPAVAIVDSLVPLISQRHNSPVTININVNERNSQSITHQTRQESTTTKSALEIEEREPDLSLYDRGISWIKQNKFRTAFYCFGGWYAITHIYLLYLANMICSENCWSRWKNQCTLEELYRIKQTDLIKDLFQTLEVRDSAYQKESNQILRLMRFVSEADEEIGYLQKYQRVVRFLERTGLRRICFYSGLDPADATDRLRRLQFIKNSAYGWLNELRGQQSYGAMFTPQR